MDEKENVVRKIDCRAVLENESRPGGGLLIQSREVDYLPAVYNNSINCSIVDAGPKEHCAINE